MRTKTQIGNLVEHLVLNIETMANQINALRYSLVGDTATGEPAKPFTPHPGDGATLQDLIDYWADRAPESLKQIDRDLGELAEFAETAYAPEQKAPQGR